MGVSILAFISNLLLLIFASMAVCCGGPSKNKNRTLVEYTFLTYFIEEE